MPQIKAARIKKSLERSVSIKGALGRRGDLIRDLVNAGYRVQDVGGERRFVSLWIVLLAEGSDQDRLGLRRVPFRPGVPASDPLFSIAPREDSAAFKKWFKDSEVVDSDGRPLVVYHSGDFDESVDGVPRTENGMHFGTKQAAQERVTGAVVDAAILGATVTEEGGRWVWDMEDGLSSDVYTEEGFDSESEARVDMEATAIQLGEGAMEEFEERPLTVAYLSILNPKRVLDQKGRLGKSYRRCQGARPRWDCVPKRVRGQGEHLLRRLLPHPDQERA